MDEERIKEIYDHMETIISNDESNCIKIGRLSAWIEMLGWEAYPDIRILEQNK